MKLLFLKNTTLIVFFSLLPILSWGQYKNLKQEVALNPNSIKKATQPIDYSQKLELNPKAAEIRKKYTRPQKALPTEELNFSSSSFDLSTFSVASARKKALSNRKIEVVKDESGLPIFITGKQGYRLHEFSQNSRNKVELEKEVFNFLDSYKQELKIIAPKEEFRIKETLTDSNGNQHFRMDQVYQGIPVYGKQLIVHIDKDGVYALNGRYEASPKKVINQQNITSEQAMLIIEKDLGKKRHILSEKLKKYVDDYEPPTLVFYADPVEQTFILAWQVDFHADNLKHWSFIIDTKNGEILEKIHSSCGFTGPATAIAQDLNGNDQVINTWDDGDIFVLADASRPMFDLNTFDGSILTLDAQFAFDAESEYNLITSPSNIWTDAGAVSAHFNAGISYEYFRQTFNRNSMDGLGGSIISVVNYAKEGDADNAFFSRNLLIYAKGKNAFQPVSLAKSLDVVAHEFSHGVVSNSAGLEYKFQSGALNESFADVFGVMVDRDDWRVGEEVVRPDVYLSGAMRDVANPNNGGNLGDNGWQPANMSEYLNWELDRDNGGVHYNSGIPNRAFYLFATAVGKEKAEQVYYKALTQYLTKTSQFIDCRLAVIQSAQDLYGTAEVAAATAAFDAVGIFGEDGTSSQEDLPAVVGDEFVLTQASTDNGVVIGEIEMATGDYTIKSSTDFNPRLSIVEEGSIAYFIGTDQKAYIIDLNNPDANNNFELLFSTDSELRFHQIAISRDGRRIAFLSSPRTPNIIFYDFDNGSFNQFPITNPNTGTGTVESAPDFLDVIQFDPTGQYIMYDAYNSIDASAGFWDIGFLRVWDNGTNSLGNGQIAKPFTAIPPGISVGNPVFSNTSFNRIAFEFFNFDDENALVITQDLNSGDFAIVAENKFYDDFSLLGRPYFSPDDQFIAYVTDKDEDANYVTFQALEEDKLTPQGEPFGGYFGEAPIWYSKGTRAFLPPVAEFKANITEGDATLTVNFREESTNSPLAWKWTFDGGTPNTSTERNPIVSYSTPGIYDVKLTVTNDAGSNTRTRNGYIIVRTGELQPIANFSANRTSGNSPLSVTYADNSQNSPTSWQWTFWGGTPSTSTEQNPTITYNTPGSYMVELVARNGAGENRIIRDNFITVTESAFLNVNINQLNVIADISTTSFSVQSNTNWSISKSGGSEWVNLSQDNGTNNATINLTIAANPNTTSRTATLTVQSLGVGSQIITVTQEGQSSSISLVAPALTSPADGANFNQDTIPFSWQPVNGATMYHYEISANSLFSPIAYEVDWDDTSIGVWGFGENGVPAAWFWRVKAINADGEGPYSATRQVNSNSLSTSIHDLLSDQSFSVFPNPATEQFTLQFAKKIESAIQLNIVTITGQVVQQAIIPKGNTVFKYSLGNLPGGVYWVYLYGEEGRMLPQKLVVY